MEGAQCLPIKVLGAAAMTYAVGAIAFGAALWGNRLFRPKRSTL